jgi:peptidoglycan-associated lipoprotein
MQTRSAVKAAAVLVIVVVVMFGACAKKKPPIARPMPPPDTTEATPPPSPPKPPEPVVEPPVVPSEPVPEDTIGSRSLDDLNRDSPLKPVFFELDSAELSAENQSVLDADAALLKKYPTWVVTIEGHCDERGTAEYNLALGERRAVAARTYLVSLGLSADRLRVVSYGEEFPFDPGHSEDAWTKNRRAHFVIVSK